MEAFNVFIVGCVALPSNDKSDYIISFNKSRVVIMTKILGIISASYLSK